MANPRIQQTEMKEFKCDECGKGFKYKASLNIHNRFHSGEKPFTCEECGKTFSDKSNLSTHKKIHTGEKPFQCGECDKKFTQSSGLNKHKQIYKDCKKMLKMGKERKKRKQQTIDDTLKSDSKLIDGFIKIEPEEYKSNDDCTIDMSLIDEADIKLETPGTSF